ncbi:MULTISPECIES: hypothetical protein [unclassified Bradyrhizobium]
MLALHLDPCVPGDAGNVAFGPGHILQKSGGDRIAHQRDNWDVDVSFASSAIA